MLKVETNTPEAIARVRAMNAAAGLTGESMAQAVREVRGGNEEEPAAAAALPDADEEALIEAAAAKQGITRQEAEKRLPKTIYARLGYPQAKAVARLIDDALAGDAMPDDERRMLGKARAVLTHCFAYRASLPQRNPDAYAPREVRDAKRKEAGSNGAG